MIIPAIWHEREWQSLFLFFFFHFGAVTDSSPYPFSFFLPPRYILSQGAKQSTRWGLDYLIVLEISKRCYKRGGWLHWALLSFSPLTDRDVSIISIGSAWLIQLNVDCFIERLWKSKPPIDIDFGLAIATEKTQSGNWKRSWSWICCRLTVPYVDHTTIISYHIISYGIVSYRIVAYPW